MCVCVKQAPPSLLMSENFYANSLGLSHAHAMSKMFILIKATNLFE